MKNYVREIIRQYISGRYPEQTERAFERWMTDDSDSDTEHGAEKTRQTESLWADISGAEMSDADYSLNRICELTGISARRRAAMLSRRLRVWRSVAAAAAVIIVAGFGYFLTLDRSEADLLQAYVPKAELSNITLTDGTEVILNSKSTLIYPQEFKGDTRSVYLVGQAHFKVKSDKKRPFIVKTDDTQVEALGTSFDVEAYPEDGCIRTSLVEGKVRVGFHNGSESRILNSGDQLVYEKASRRASMNRPEMAGVTAWQRGALVLSDLTPEEIFNTLERKYPYTFVYSPRQLKRDRYTMTFDKGATINEIMDVVTQVVGGLHYEIDGDVCRIY